MADSNPLKALRDERSTVAHGIGATQAHLKRLEEKLETLDAAIRNLEPFYEAPKEPRWSVGGVAESAPGITDAVRMIFQSNSIYLAPTAIRDSLKEKGLIKGYDNEMAVIHQVIRRLEDQGQIEPHPAEKAHRWKANPINPQAPFSSVALAGNYMKVGPPPKRITPDMVADFNRGPKKDSK
jgi:hypothetical protein